MFHANSTPWQCHCRHTWWDGVFLSLTTVRTLQLTPNFLNKCLRQIMLLSLESQLAPLPDGLWYLLMGTTLLVAMWGAPHVALDWQNRLKSLIQKLCKLATTACLLSCATDYMANILKLFAVAYGETVKQLRHKNHMKKAMISPQSHFSLQVLRLRGNGLKSFFFSSTKLLIWHSPHLT